MSMSEQTANYLVTVAENQQKVYNAGYEQGKAESEGTEWVEDNSKIVYERPCYAGGVGVSLYITENGTGIYRDNGTFQSGYFTPQWQYTNFNQVSSTHDINTPKVIGIKQAEVVEDERVTTLGNRLFACMKNLKIVKLPQNITAIGNYCFTECQTLKRIELPDTVDDLESAVFQGCTSLEDFKIPSLVTSLGPYTFSACSSLKTVDGIERLENIGTNCFDGCVELSSVLVFNENLDSLGANTFKNCFSITEVRFLGAPTSIGANVFDNCVNITDIYVPWAEGEVANAPWGASNATIHYNTTYDENHNPIV